MGRAFAVRGCNILRCGTCGLGRTEVPAEFDPSRYYSAAYFEGGLADGYADYVGSRDVLRHEFRHTLRHILGHSHRRRRLLEVGCAYGFFLDEAAAHFEDVSGIEIAADAARSCQSRGLHVVEGVVRSDTVTGPYDAVVGLDVIEHVPDPSETVRVLAHAMAPRGVMVLTTGDWASLTARIMGPNWRLMTPPQHLSFFTPQSMTAMLTRAGLSVVEINYPWKRVPLSLVVYQLQRLLQLRPRRLPLPGAIPINLWDAMRVTAVKAQSTASATHATA